MKIEILGCSGSVMQGFNTTSILINDKILIDAGSVMSVLPDSALARIKDILITHPHMDHIKELPFFVDALFARKAKGLRIMGSRETIEALKTHVFNGLLWPDIERLYSDRSCLRLEPVESDWFDLDGIRVKAFAESHIRGSIGYVLCEEGKKVLFTGDTGFHKDLFDLIKSLGSDLKACFIEASFPSSMGDLAAVTRHMTPELIMKGLNGDLSPSTRIIIYHMKPKHMEEVVAELPQRYEYIRGGEVITI